MSIDSEIITSLTVPKVVQYSLILNSKEWPDGHLAWYDPRVPPWPDFLKRQKLKAARGISTGSLVMGYSGGLVQH